MTDLGHGIKVVVVFNDLHQQSQDALAEHGMEHSNLESFF